MLCQYYFVWIGNKSMKKYFLFTILIVVALTACTPPGTAIPADLPVSSNPTPAVETSTETPTAEIPEFIGTEISFATLTLVLPPGIAEGASGGEIPPYTDPEAAWWQKAPAHLEVSLGGYYLLQGKSRQPRILVFPVQEYAELVPAALESMQRVNDILRDPNAPISPDQLPALPFFNEQQVFATNLEVLSFQNGRGVRFLSEYGQSATSANNRDLFYQFQGLTNDGAYYIIAILPITAPGLGESNDPAAAVPVEGISFPSMGNLNADWEPYYAAVTHYLETLPAESFTPTLGQLDALIQSMEIMP
jgi:hypothetical protein